MEEGTRAEDAVLRHTDATVHAPDVGNISGPISKLLFSLFKFIFALPRNLNATAKVFSLHSSQQVIKIAFVRTFRSLKHGGFKCTGGSETEQ